MSFIQWIDAKYPELKQFVFHIPNGGKRGIREAVRFKQMGVRAGVWDVFCNISHSHFHGLWIEFKTKGRKLSEEQILFLDSIKRNKQDWAVCYTIDEAIYVFESYICGKIDNGNINKYREIHRDSRI